MGTKIVKKFKEAKTIKEYKVNYNGYDLVIPIGSIVNNRTTCGYNDCYRFLQNCSNVARKATGKKNSMLLYDLLYYGLNIPANFCEPYEL